MLTIRQKKNVIDNKVVLEVPDHFGKEVEVIILSRADENESRNYNAHLKEWDNLTVKEFLEGYDDKDSIYDDIEK